MLRKKRNKNKNWSELKMSVAQQGPANSSLVAIALLQSNGIKVVILSLTTQVHFTNTLSDLPELVSL